MRCNWKKYSLSERCSLDQTEETDLCDRHLKMVLDGVRAAVISKSEASALHRATRDVLLSAVGGGLVLSAQWLIEHWPTTTEVIGVMIRSQGNAKTASQAVPALIVVLPGGEILRLHLNYASPLLSSSEITVYDIPTFFKHSDLESTLPVPSQPFTRLGDAIKKRRGDQSMTDLAQELGVREYILDDLERGMDEPSLKVALILASWLGWTIKELSEAAEALL